MKDTASILKTLETLRDVAYSACSAASKLEGVARAIAYFNVSEEGEVADDQLKATLDRGEKVCVWADIEFHRTHSQKDEAERDAANIAFASALGGDFQNVGDGDGTHGHIECYASDFLGIE